MSKIIRYKYSLDHLPELSANQKAELEALKNQSEAEIDLVDLPEIKDWSNTIAHPLYKPIKKSTTVRIDADVMQWLKSQGKGYQTRMNKILRDAMLKELNKHS